MVELLRCVGTIRLGAILLRLPVRYTNRNIDVSVFDLSKKFNKSLAGKIELMLRSTSTVSTRWDVLQNTTDAATTCRQTTFEQHTIESRLIDDYLVDRNHKMCYIDGELYFLTLR
jgi:hypothetical protein